MLTFTGAGVVASPETLQVRIGTAHAGRIAAGAPAPTRGLSPDEVLANALFFGARREGPRSKACKAIVLSGLDTVMADRLPGTIAALRADSYRHVTLHAGSDPRLAGSELAAHVDAIALTLRVPEDVAAVRAAPADRHRTAVVVVDGDLDPELMAELFDARPSRIVMTWPFPDGSGRIPSPAPVAAATIAKVTPALDASAIPWGVKGLPACALDRPDRLWRSSNRYYVDADHQKEAALMFFPDVVRFSHADECRFCAVADRCDGAPAEWLARGIAGKLRAVS